MQQLSYADRASIFQIVAQLRRAPPIPDDELLRTVSGFLLAHHAQSGFEHALARDAIALCNHVRVSPQLEVRETAQAALRYLLKEKDFCLDTTPVIGLQDDVYILGLALHEIAELTGIPARYGAPGLTEEERALAETQLEHFVDDPLLPDGELVIRARQFCEQIRNLAETGCLGRMRRNIESMIGILDQPGTSDAHAWSRGALSYLAYPADVIPDDLGLVGYLDDRHILDTAMAMIQPQPDPWLSILDETVQQWPFLNWLILSENGTRYQASEFLIANAALALGRLAPAMEPLQAAIIVPNEGPLPALLSFISALGLVCAAAQREGGSLEFQKGQKVLVDGTAVWIFDGYERINGREMFRLTQYRRGRGGGLPTSRLWPVTELVRLRSTGEDRAVRGQIIYDMDSNPAPISAIDRLLHTKRPFQLGSMKQHLLSVANVTSTREIMRHLRLFGERLSDVLPMGSVTCDGEIDIWSERWRGTSPVLLFLPSVDRTSDFLEDADAGEAPLLIVDGKGAIARQSVSLRRISKTRIPLLAIARERDHQDLEVLSAQGFEFFEWEPRDLRELLWQASPGEMENLQIRSYEQHVATCGRASAETRRIGCPEAIAAYEALLALRRVHARREDAIDELTKFLAMAGGLMHTLAQSVIPMARCDDLAARIDRNLATLANLLSTGLFMSAEERHGSGKVLAAFKKLEDRLRFENPKASALAELLCIEPRITIICHDATAASETRAYWMSEEARRDFPMCRAAPDVIPCPRGNDDKLSSTAVIVGWFGKRRMPDLIQPPIAANLTLLLYEFESAWSDSLRRACECARSKRGGRGTRHRLLGNKKLWRPDGAGAPASPPASDAEPERETPESDDFDALVTGYRRARAIAYARGGGADEPDVEAMLFWFAGGSHAFLTSSYKAKAVTHLIEGTVRLDSLEKAEVRLVRRQDLSVGDWLLFHLGSDADAIRMVADEQLGSPAIRKTAKLWQSVLRGFRDRNGLTDRQVWNRLKDGGCDHHLLTVRNWLSDEDMIAPRDAHDHELEIIANVTRDGELRDRMIECDAAIREVWGAHLTASHHLAVKVVERVARSLSQRAVTSDTGLLEIDPSVVVARLDEIEPGTATVKRSMSNRLNEGPHD